LADPAASAGPLSDRSKKRDRAEAQPERSEEGRGLGEARARLPRTVNGVTESYANDNGDKLTSVSVDGSAIKMFLYDAAGVNDLAHVRR
jgi:hypothetical protein